MPIGVDDREYTAFEADSKLYQFTRMPFGLTNGVAAFQRTIEKIIENENLSNVFAFVDNATTCGNSQEEHDLNLKKFLEVTEKYSMTINKDTIIIAVSSLALLGYVIEKGVVNPDPARFQALDDLKIPQNTAAQHRGVIFILQ